MGELILALELEYHHSKLRGEGGDIDTELLLRAKQFVVDFDKHPDSL